MHKCPEIIAGANFSLKTSTYWTIIMRYAHCLEKSLLQMILKTYLNYCKHLKATSERLLQSWRAGSSYCSACKSSQQSVLPLILLECFFSMCLLVLMLSEEEVHWASLYRLLSRTGLPWIRPGCTGPAWLPQRSAIEKRAGQPALVSISVV